MKKFYLQSGYDGKETSSIAYCYDKEEISYSAVSEYQDGQIPVGSVEFVEKFIGIQKPLYYPSFLQDFFKRKIWYMGGLYYLEDEDRCFIKPLDRHKRFESRIVSGYEKYAPTLYSWQTGPYLASDIVHFKEEWRYYIAQGEVLAAHWYKGEEEEIEPPFSFLRQIDWPKYFCGAVDFGKLDNGEIALVENNLPYGCGWYGPYEDGIIYGEWLKEGWEFIKKYKS